MELYQIYVILIGLVIIFYGIPFYFIKGDRKVYYTLFIGTILFYAFSGIFVFFMDLYEWDNGKYPFLELIILALFVSLPFVLIVNLGMALLYYLIRKKASKKLK